MTPDAHTATLPEATLATRGHAHYPKTNLLLEAQLATRGQPLPEAKLASGGLRVAARVDDPPTPSGSDRRGFTRARGLCAS